MTTKLGKSRTKTIIDADYCYQVAITFSRTLYSKQTLESLGISVNSHGKCV